MRFAVVGAGAIGAFVGACLTRGGASAVLIARGTHLEAMRRRGVRIVSQDDEFTVDVEATDDLGAVSGADCVIVGVKAPALPGLMPRLAPVLRSDACVLPAQNGVPWWFFQRFSGPFAGSVVQAVDPAGAIAEAIPPEGVVGCVSYPATEISHPGVIRHIEGTRFVIGELDGQSSQRCRDIADAFSAGGLTCRVRDGIRSQLWTKLIGNVALNPASALTGGTLGQLGESQEMVAVLRRMMEETKAVGEALGIDVPVSIDKRLKAAVAVGDHKTSMLQDLDAGKPLELDCLSGAVLEIAGWLDLDTPCVESVHACAKLLESVRLGHQRTREEDTGQTVSTAT